MISRLLIENLVLVERAEIPFGPGLNILTGETGSGKSAILTAIRLILGGRAETELVRRGTDRAVIEATLRLNNEEIVIRREVSASGKSRIFLDEAQLTLSELREQLGRSIELVDQSSSLQLRIPEEQLALLDAFANIDTSALADVVAKLTRARASLEALELSQATSAEREQKYLEELAAIQEVNWQRGEEEALASEHHLLTHAHEILTKIAQVNEALTEGNQPIIPRLKRFMSLLGNELALQQVSDALKTASLELDEASAQLTRIAESLEINPPRLQAVEERIAAIETLKRRFGLRQEGVEAHRRKLEEHLEQITHREDDLEQAKQTVTLLQGEADVLAARIKGERRKAAPRFAKSVLAELVGLNLPHAQFEIQFSEKPLGAKGTDSVHFQFTANPGLPIAGLGDQASGGELSRLLFAIKAALAERGSSTLIFDEIDSNVGGQTAARLGEKLLAMSKRRQLICITHFVQVARCAMDHFGVVKTTNGAHAITRITKLEGSARAQEFARMMGS